MMSKKFFDNILKLLFFRAVKKYSNVQTLGVRELFSIEDEIQSNGKIFKKVFIKLIKIKT